MHDFIKGIVFLFAGFRLISKPGIRHFVVIPLLINIVIFFALFFLLSHYMSAFNLWILHFLPAWLQWLNIFLWLAFAVSFILVFVFAFVAVANIVGAPFNSFLAENVEYHLNGMKPVSRPWSESLKDARRIIGRQLAIVFYYLPRVVFMLILFLIPLVQLIAPLMWFFFNAWFISLAYYDYPADNHRQTFTEMLAILRQNRAVTFGFGTAVLIATMIPVVNFFVIPAAVAGATKWWAQQGMVSARRSD